MSGDTSYYVYALKDQRTSPAMPFYIGKGTGTRSFDSLVKPDQTRKGLKIREIEAAGARVLVSRLVDALDEHQAMKLETESIAAFGTIDTDGIFTNSVLPSGLSKKARSSVVVPSGVKEKAQVGLSLLKEAIVDLAKANPTGVSDSAQPVFSGFAATTVAARRTTCRTACSASSCERASSKGPRQTRSTSPVSSERPNPSFNLPPRAG